MLPLILFAVFLLASCTNNGEEAGIDETNQAQSIEGDPHEPVALVNDVELTLKDLRVVYNTIASQYESIGMDPKENPEINERIITQAIDQIIDYELIRQEAVNLGLEATDEEVQEQIDITKSTLEQQGRHFDEVLAQNDMTEESYREQLATNIIISKYMEAHTDVVSPEDVQVTETEVNLMLAEFGPEELSDEELEKQRVEIEERLISIKVQEKNSEQHQEIIKTLRETAEIELF